MIKINTDKYNFIEGKRGLGHDYADARRIILKHLRELQEELRFYTDEVEELKGDDLIVKIINKNKGE